MATSFRTAFRACPHPNCLLRRPTTPSITTAAAATNSTPPTTRTFISQGHQRRHSSSKPPVPPNHGSSGLPAGTESSVKAVGPRSRTSTEKRPGPEARATRRRAREKALTGVPVMADGAAALPSVPPTQWLQPKDVHLASLFSTHRPISIMAPIPSSTETEAFEQIFAAKPKKSDNPADVIYTLSSAVQALDSVIQQQQTGPSKQSSPESERIAQMRQALAQQHGNQAADPNQPQVQYFTDLKQALDEVARNFRPFNPPPVPVALSEEEFAAAQEKEAVAAREREQSEASDTQSSHHQDNSEVILVRQNEDGSLESEFFTAAHPLSELYSTTAPSSVLDPTSHQPISNPTSPSTSIHLPSSTSNRVLHRHRRELPTRTELIIHAISVRRQRKLKMKKHKFKKMWRRLRNQRRQLA